MTRYAFSWYTDSGTWEVVLDVDDEVDAEYWKEANEFWSFAEERESAFGSHKEAYLRILATEIMVQEMETGAAAMVWRERPPEGFYAIDGSEGVMLVRVDVAGPLASDLDVNTSTGR